jgi:hypothetical protein
VLLIPAPFPRCHASAPSDAWNFPRRRARAFIITKNGTNQRPAREGHTRLIYARESRYKSMAWFLVVVAAVLTAQSFARFLGDEADDHKRGYGVYPPRAEHEVCQEADNYDERQPAGSAR